MGPERARELELELELELALEISRSFLSLIFCFLRRSSLLPRLPFFVSFGIAEFNLADFCLSHQGHAILLR